MHKTAAHIACLALLSFLSLAAGRELCSTDAPIDFYCESPLWCCGDMACCGLTWGQISATVIGGLLGTLLVTIVCCVCLCRGPSTTSTTRRTGAVRVGTIAVTSQSSAKGFANPNYRNNPQVMDSYPPPDPAQPPPPYPGKM